MPTITMGIPRAGRELLRVAVPAATVAMAMNAGWFLLGALGGVFPLRFAPAEGPMTLAPVLLVSAIGVLGGFAAYAWLRTRAQAPLRVFTTLALGVLLVSFAAPLLVPAWSTAEILLLDLMHATVAAVTVFSVTMVDEDERDSL